MPFAPPSSPLLPQSVRPAGPGRSYFLEIKAYKVPQILLSSQNRRTASAAGQSMMNQEIPRKRTTRFTRAARILKRARDGFAYDDVAREEKITVRRVQQIVADEIKRREADANLQLDWLGHAMRVACEALAEGDVKAIAPFVKVFDRLDHCHVLAREARPPRRRRDADKAVMKERVARVGRPYADEVAAAPAGRPAEAAPDAPRADDPPPVAARLASGARRGRESGGLALPSARHGLWLR